MESYGRGRYFVLEFNNKHSNNSEFVDRSPLSFSFSHLSRVIPNHVTEVSDRSGEGSAS
jgi:hypothetical protein